MLAPVSSDVSALLDPDPPPLGVGIRSRRGADAVTSLSWDDPDRLDHTGCARRRDVA